MMAFFRQELVVLEKETVILLVLMELVVLEKETQRVLILVESVVLEREIWTILMLTRASTPKFTFLMLHSETML